MATELMVTDFTDFIFTFLCVFTLALQIYNIIKRKEDESDKNVDVDVNLWCVFHLLADKFTKIGRGTLSSGTKADIFELKSENGTTIYYAAIPDHPEIKRCAIYTSTRELLLTTNIVLDSERMAKLLCENESESKPMYEIKSHDRTFFVDVVSDIADEDRVWCTVYNSKEDENYITDFYLNNDECEIDDETALINAINNKMNDDVWFADNIS